MTRCTVAHNDEGIRVFIDGAGNVATATVTQSVIAFNGLAVFNNGGGQQSFNTFADNRFVFNGQDITDTTRLLNVIAQIKPGTDAKVHLVRKNKEMDLNVMIGKRPPPPKQPSDESDDDDGG